MNLFDLLMNRKSGTTTTIKPSLAPLQMDANGGIDAEAVARVKDYINSPEAKAQAIAPTLAERLFGRDITTDTQTIDPETNAVTMETKSLHQPGYFEQAGAGLKRGINDLLGGYSENRTQNFSVDNWNNNYLDNGNKKGLAYRLGEGLGSFAKLAESPIGRSLLVGGIVGATGGDGLQALTYGAQTGVMNQQNRAKDQMYRKALAERGIDTSGIRGYVGDDMFKSILEDAQLRDNAEYRNAMLQTQVNNQREMMEYRKQEAERQARQDRIDTDIEYKKLGLQEKALAQKGNNVKPLSDSQVEKITTAQDTIEALINIETRYRDPKYKNAFGLKGAIRTEQAKNHPILYAPFDNEITLVRQDIDMLRQKYAKAMEGGRMSDSDRAFYQNVLMSQNLSYENFLEGVKRLKESEQKSLQRRIANYGMQGKDVSEFEKYTPQIQTTTNEGWAF